MHFRISKTKVRKNIFRRISCKNDKNICNKSCTKFNYFYNAFDTFSIAIYQVTSKNFTKPNVHYIKMFGDDKQNC